MAWLESTGPDIVCLQETKCPDDQFPELALRSAGYNSAFHGEKSYNGVAILSKTEMQQVRASLCDEEIDPQARVISATVSGVRIYSVYAPNGQAVGSPAYEYKLKWYRRLRDCLGREGVEADGEVELVVAGDFNVAPEDVDVHDPSLWHGAIMCSAGERAAFQDLCSVGLVDTLRLHHREKKEMFTWWDYRMLAFPKNRGLRIDAVLASGPMAKRCTAAEIDRDVRKGKEPSDHAPIWAAFAEPEVGPLKR